MTTITDLRSLERVGFHEDNHPVWKNAFNSEVRRELIEDDLTAGNSVTGVLVTIVTIGLLLMIGSVAIIFLV